ncbi:MAG TPA: YraN family protein [Steroidobacteraceae bacterium]
MRNSDAGPERDDDAAVDATTTVLGRRAEDLALRHLEQAGLELLTRNYRCRAGELDLVMLEPVRRTLVLVEVRSRSRNDYGRAAATVGFGKQRRVTLAARHLLMTRRELRRLRARFDVVAIDPPAEPGGAAVVTWIRGAFTSPP